MGTLYALTIVLQRRQRGQQRRQDETLVSGSEWKAMGDFIITGFNSTIAH
jgi:hypothetical protein